MTTQTMSEKSYLSGPLASAIKKTSPIVLGYLPVGFAYGVLAQKMGLSEFNTILMSVIVFAGSAQLIAVGLLGAGASPLSVVATTFIVNLRHVLMSASLAPYLGHWCRRELAWFGFQVTDETFALHSVRFGQGDNHKPETFGINSVAQVAWIGGTGLGVVASAAIADVRPFGLDFALPAMFIALIAVQLKDRTHVLVGLISGGLSLLLFTSGVDQWNVILATVAGATVGTGVGLWIRR